MASTVRDFESTDRRFAELIEAQRRIQEEVRQLVKAVQALIRQMASHAKDLGDLKTMDLEDLYQREAPALLRPLLRRAVPLSGEEKMRLLEAAEAAGRITEEEADRAAPLDLLVRGIHRREDRPLDLAVEISWLGGTEDVERALERARIFARALEAEVWPVVAAKDLTPPARTMARHLGVWWVQDGRAFAPHEIPEQGPEPEKEGEEPTER